MSGPDPYQVTQAALDAVTTELDIVASHLRAARCGEPGLTGERVDYLAAHALNDALARRRTPPGSPAR